MQTHLQYSLKPSFALLLIGPPLSGKTNISMGFPDPYFLDADDKLLNAIQRHPNKRFWFDCPLRRPDGTMVEEQLQWDYAMNSCLIPALKSPDVKTIVLSSGSALSHMLKQHIMRFPTPGTKGQLMVGGEKVMELTQWQPFGDIWRKTIMACRASGKLFVMEVHEETEKDELTGWISYKPLIPGAMKNGLGGLFTDVWHTETRTKPDTKNPGKMLTEYFVRTEPSARMTLGNTLGLPAEFVFSWEEVEKRLYKPTPVTSSLPVAPPLLPHPLTNPS